MNAIDATATMNTPRVLLVVGTGGTIAGQAASAHDAIGYQAGVVPVAHLLDGVPLPPGWSVRTQQVANLDSKDMGPPVWQALLDAVAQALQMPDVGAIVVTHGTDTLEETAWLLQAALAPQRPVVLTGAMRPASALAPDGPQNLADAVTLACDARAQAAGGVWVTLAARVFDAAAVRKEHATRLDAFGAGDAGPAGWVEGGRVRWCAAAEGLVAAMRALVPAAPLPPRAWRSSPWPRVEWISSHAGADGALVRALLRQREAALRGEDADAPLQGLVVAGTGNGSVHAELAQALQQAAQAGVVVWLTTRCAQGVVVSGSHGRAVHAWPVTPLPPAKARVALQLQLMAAAAPRG